MGSSPASARMRWVFLPSGAITHHMLDDHTTWRVARVFFDEPTSALSLREVGRKAGIAHTTATGHLDALQRLGVVNVEHQTRGERSYPVYSADLASDAYRLYKRMDLETRLWTEGLVELLRDHYAPDHVVLFGSAARGEDIESSDIDLYVQATEERPPDLSRIEEDLHRTIELHVHPDARKLPRELRANLANGVVLYGYLEVFD